MKKIKPQKLIGFKLRSSLLSISIMLVITACYFPSDRDDNETLDYKQLEFTGTVVSADSLKPIPNIRVRALSEKKSYYYDTTNVLTDEKGRYSYTLSTTKDEQIEITAWDKDDTANGGKFKTAVYRFKVSGRDYASGGRVVDIKMKRAL